MGEFTEAQQKGRTAYLGVAFMIMFTAFNSLQNIVSKIYNDYGYTNLGTASVLLLYFVYGLFPFIASFIIRKLGYKKAMFFSSLGYAVFEGAGLVITLWEGMPTVLGWIFVMVGAVFCGAGAGVIWVAQGSYVSDLAGEENRTKLFAMFWGIMMSSQILGSILTTFVLGLIGNTAYFIVLTVLGCKLAPMQSLALSSSCCCRTSRRQEPTPFQSGRRVRRSSHC
jgi:MFS family permease